jgi:hypothetical protein
MVKELLTFRARPKILYRGLKGVELSHRMQDLTLNVFTSTSFDRSVAVDNFGGSGGILLEIETNNNTIGADVKELSAFPTESEILLAPMQQLQIVGVRWEGPLKVVQCRSQKPVDGAFQEMEGIRLNSPCEDLGFAFAYKIALCLYGLPLVAVILSTTVAFMFYFVKFLVEFYLFVPAATLCCASQQLPATSSILNQSSIVQKPSSLSNNGGALPSRQPHTWVRSSIADLLLRFDSMRLLRELSPEQRFFYRVSTPLWVRWVKWLSVVYPFVAAGLLAWKRTRVDIIPGVFKVFTSFAERSGEKLSDRCDDEDFWDSNCSEKTWMCLHTVFFLVPGLIVSLVLAVPALVLWLLLLTVEVGWEKLAGRSCHLAMNILWLVAVDDD